MNDEPVWYIDSSALVKLVVSEPETVALRADLLTKPRLAGSELLFVEVPRAAMRHGQDAAFRGRAVVDALAVLVEIDHQLLDRASSLPLAVLGSLDAIHLATAMSLGASLAGMVTYDTCLAEAAVAVGIAVASPGR